MTNKSEIGLLSVLLLSALSCAEPSESGASGSGAGGVAAIAGGAGGASLTGGGGTAGTMTMSPSGAGGTSGTGGAPHDGGVDADEPDTTQETLPPLPFDCAQDAWALNAVDVGEVSLNVACRADEARTAPLAILLHGFPELHLAWNALAAPLREHGFALLAPDQRGYNTSDKPEPVEAYAVEHIVADLHGLIEASGRERVLLIGHDWGGLIAFVYAHQHPERVHGLVILNGPHPDIWGHPEIDPVQGMASEGYVPLLTGPTATLSMPVLDSLLMPHLTPEELERYRAAWSVPEAYASMCKWYDANVYPEVTMPTGVTLSVPVLALWGMDDTFVTPSQLEHLPSYVPDLEIVKLEGVDHWITHQATDVLSEHIVTFEARLAKE